MGNQKPQCPNCTSVYLSVERRPDGDARCLHCSWAGPYKQCFPFEVANDPARYEHREIMCPKCQHVHVITTTRIEPVIDEMKKRLDSQHHAILDGAEKEYLLDKKCNELRAFACENEKNAEQWKKQYIDEWAEKKLLEKNNKELAKKFVDMHSVVGCQEIKLETQAKEIKRLKEIEWMYNDLNK